MPQQVRHNRTIRSIRILGMAAALGLLVVGLSQCRMVSDNITGVNVGSNRLSAKGQCVKACNDAYEDGARAEESRHKEATRACGNDKACKDAENKVHDANMDKLQDQRKNCKRGCYNEGGGKA